eukprot:2125477-Heterocapsa_arctica.AAC.1
MVGSPHLHVWVAMLSSIVETSSTVKLTLAASHDLKQVKDYALQTLQPSDVQDMSTSADLIRRTKKEPAK